jgi:hypothetical protein
MNEFLKNNKKEIVFGEMLKTMFTKLEIIEKFKIGIYEVEYYIPLSNLLIEYNQKQKDEKREEGILKELGRKIKRCELLYDGDVDNWTDSEREKASTLFTFINIKEGEEIQGLREIMKHYINQGLHELVL